MLSLASPTFSSLRSPLVGRSCIMLAPYLLVHCPPLSPGRPYPSLLVRNLTPVSTDSSKVHNSYALPVPAPLTIVPYAYGRPTLLSRSNDSRYLLVFWPRLSDKTTSELSQAASNAAVPISTLANSTTALEPSLQSHFVSDEEEAEDLGGLLALYTRPQPSSRRTAYAYDFEIVSHWLTEYNAVTSAWLYEPRRWHVRERSPKTVASPSRQRSGPNGMNIDMAPETRTSDADGAHNNIDSPELTREPHKGPLPPFALSSGSSRASPLGNSHPPLAYLVLFSNHHLNFYFSFESALTRPPPSYPLNKSPNIKVSTLSCPILNPSTVSDQPKPHREEESTGNNSDIVSEQQQVTINHPRTRLIVPGEARISIRQNDETIWVGFRNYRPRNIWFAEQNGAKIRTNDQNGESVGDLDPLNPLTEGLDEATGRSIGKPPRGESSLSVREGEEEPWMHVSEVKLNVREGATCKS